MRKVVHRIDTPGLAGALVIDMTNSVQRGIAQVHVWRRHVYFCAQHVLAIGKLAVAHAPEQIEVLLDATITMRAVLARLGQRAAILANFFSAQTVDVGNTELYEFFGRRVYLRKIIRCMRQPVLVISLSAKSSIAPSTAAR